MAKVICVLRPACTDDEADDCRRHYHVNRRQAHELLKRGQIALLDIHPGKLLPRYVWTVIRPTPSAISAGIARRAAGEFGSREQRWALERVRDYRNQKRHETRRLISGHRWVTLHRLASCPDGLAAYVPRGRWDVDWQPVRVMLKPKTPETMADALVYLRWINPAAFTRFNTTDPEGTLAKSIAWLIMKRSKKLLADVWPRVVRRVSAGKFSREINTMPPAQLPSSLVAETFRVYLGL